MVAAVPLRAQESVDLVLHNGKIFTADQLLSTFSAVAVRGDRIVALGWDGLLDRYRAARTVDLGGKLVVPGFIDTHIHISGDAERWVDLAGLANMAELKARVTRKAELLGSAANRPKAAIVPVRPLCPVLAEAVEEVPKLKTFETMIQNSGRY